MSFMPGRGAWPGGVCEQGRPGERYLLTGENISMSELVTKIAQIAGVRCRARFPCLSQGLRQPCRRLVTSGSRDQCPRGCAAIALCPRASA